MEEEKKRIVTISLDLEENEVVVVKNGHVYRSKASGGREPCKMCALGSGGRSCVWSMVCSNVTNGAIFKRFVTSEERKAAEEAHGEHMASLYEGRRYSGD